MTTLDRQVESFGNHLRRIHFALVVASGSLFLAIQYASLSDYHIAERQIKIVVGNIDSFSPASLDHYADQVGAEIIDYKGVRTRSELTKEPPRYSWMRMRSEQDETLLPLPDKSSFLLDFERLAHKVQLEFEKKCTFRNRKNVPQVQREMSLIRFREAWNIWQEQTELVCIWGVRGTLSASDQTPRASAAASEASKSTVAYPMPLFLKPRLVDPLNDGSKISLTPLLAYFRVNPATDLFQLRQEEFSEAFQTLGRVVRREGLTEASLESIESAIEAKQAEKTEPVRLFGLQFPVSILGTYGALLLIVIQLYYLVHLRGTADLLKKAWGSSEAGQDSAAIPFVGFYRDKLSRTTFVITGLVLPSVSTLFLTRVSVLQEESLRFVFYPFISAALSYGTFREIARIWKIQIK